MASVDDGNTCTIETDSAGPRMTPTSSTMRTLVDTPKDNYLNYLSRMPMQLQIEDSDAVIINARGDVRSAQNFQRQLLKTNLVTWSGQHVKPIVKLISEIAGFEQENLNNIAIALKKTNYIFLFATKSLCDPQSILSRLETILIRYAEKKNIIPVNTKSKKYRDYSLGPMYSGVKTIEFWSPDQFFVKSVQRLFEMKIDDRCRRERELEDERKKCYLELIQEQQKRVQLGHQLNQDKTTISPNESLSNDMHRLKLRENSSFCVQNQSLQNSGPQVESISNSQIQLDGPASSIAVATPHSHPHAQPINYPHVPPTNQYGFSEIPHERMLSHTPSLESSSQRWFYTQQGVPISSYHHTSNLSSPETLTSSMEVQLPASDFTGHPILYPQFTQVQNESASSQPVPMVYHSHPPPPPPRHPHPHSQEMAYSYGQLPFDPSQVFRLSGASQPSYTMETTHRQSMQGGKQSQSSSTSKFTSQTSDPSFQFTSDNSVPKSCSASSTQSGVVQNIFTINIHRVEYAAIGSNPTLVRKTTDSSNEEDSVGHDGDSDSSDSFLNQESNPGLDKERSEKDAPVFMRSSGGRISTADGVTSSSSTGQPVSASGIPESSLSSDIQEPNSQRNTDSTHLKDVSSQRDEDSSTMTHETIVKQVFED